MINKSRILGSREQIALHCLAVMALREDRTAAPVPLQTLSDQQGVSLSYLEQIFADLRRAGIVKSFRGPGGGYSLATDPEHISVYTVYLATAPKDKPGPAARGSVSGKITAWLDTMVHDAFSGKTLADMVAAA